MKIIKRINKSIQDGSFAFKLLNRLSPIDYVPGPQKEINDYLAKHYPRGQDWRKLSPAGKKIWIEYHPVFDHHEIRTIAYVGANEGATALALNEAFPGIEFYLLEPVPQTFAILVEKTKLFGNMHCLNIAAGAKDEEKSMLVDEFSPASSLLPYEPIALAEFPLLGKQRIVPVQVRSLDSVIKEKKITSIDLLLMDVQGYEDEVLLGAKETLRCCKVVVSELSFKPLYCGSSVFDSVYQALVREGFQLQYFINPMQGESRQLLQIDGIFVRNRYE